MAFNPDKCLKFEALANNCTISLPATKVDGSHYQFSKDGINWQNDSITLNNGETCYVKGTQYPTNTTTTVLSATFTISAPAKIISGSIMSLVDDGAGEQKEITINQAFCHLFENAANLMSIPSTLLPAEILTKQCYYAMFYRCSGLTTLPRNLLPAKTFSAESCYDSMFQYCTNLVSVPSGVIKAEVLNNFSLSSMFSYCSKLKEITVYFSKWEIEGASYPATRLWMNNVPAGGTFYCPKDLPQIFNDSHIPQGWTVQFLPDPLVFEHGTITFKNKYVAAWDRVKEEE